MSEVKLATTEELKQLRDWLGKIEYVDLQLCDDNFLQHFYIHRRGSMQETKDTIHNFFKSHIALGKELIQFDPSRKEVTDFFNCTLEFIVEQVSEDGKTYYAYTVMKPPLCKNFTVEFILALRRKVLVKIMNFPPTVNEMVCVVNFENHSMSALANWNISLLKTVLDVCLKSFPIRLAHFHGLNVNPIARAGVKILATLIKERAKSRISAHQDLESLYSQVPKKFLPAEIGGEAGNAQELQDKYREIELTHKEGLMKWQKSCENLIDKFQNLLVEVDTSSFRKIEVD